MIFANSNIPEKRFRLCLAEHEISELPEDRKRNMVEQKIDWPNLTSSSCKFVVLNAFLFWKVFTILLFTIESKI